MIDELLERKRRNTTGTIVEVWHYFDGQPGYHAVCVPHGGHMQFELSRDARYWAKRAGEWCPGCQVDEAT